MLVLAVTSNDRAVHGLGRWWKPLQRLAYVSVDRRGAALVLDQAGPHGRLAALPAARGAGAYRAAGTISRGLRAEAMKAFANAEASAPRILQDDLRPAPAHHHRGRIGVARDQVREHRRIAHPQALDAMHAQPRIDHGTSPGPAPCGRCRNGDRPCRSAAGSRGSAPRRVVTSGPGRSSSAIRLFSGSCAAISRRNFTAASISSTSELVEIGIERDPRMHQRIGRLDHHLARARGAAVATGPATGRRTDRG